MLCYNIDSSLHQARSLRGHDPAGSVSKGAREMLVLSRKKNESIVIDDNITIVVVEIRGDKVRLGIEAPKEVPVHRREVFDAIRRGMEDSPPQEEPFVGD